MSESVTERSESERTASVEALRMRGAIEARLFGQAEAPVRIGRFVITDAIARGGMGTVYLAYDPRLDRRVAVKVLHHGHGATAMRLTREARALAKLSHPNVVTIHEVGDGDDGVFVAMEYVEGGTLADWCAREPRGRERQERLVSFMLQAAHGLVAAHELGLVHRDLKPANMLVGADGRLRLADFGLVAGVVPSGAEAGLFTTSPGEPSIDAEAPLTESGAIVGTPAFMAPEQFEGRADAKSDQFGFCASFFVAFHGVRPYPGDTLVALRESLESGALRTGDGPVPRDVQRVLVRGLAIRPEDRFADMVALRDALQTGRARARRRRGAVVVGGVAIVGTLVAMQRGAAVDPCVDGEARLGSAWNEERRASVHAALAGVEVGFASTTADKVDGLLDDWASQWIAGYRAACEATHVDRTQSEQLLAARVRCLDRRKRDFDALVSVLSAADATVVEHAVRSAAQLGRVQSCADPTYVLAESPRPDDADVAAEVDAIDDDLAKVFAEIAAGRYDEARGWAEPLIDRAERVDFPPVLVRALDGLAKAEYARGRYDDAIAAARRAFELGELDDIRGTTANHFAMAAILHGRGDDAESLSHHRRALALARRTAAPDDPEVAAIQSSMAMVLYDLGDLDEALAVQRAALGSLVASAGEAHLTTARARSSLGAMLAAKGELDAALAEHELALASATEALGADHPELATIHHGIGFTLGRLGRAREGLAHHERALALQEAAYLHEHPKLATTHAYIAADLVELGEYDEAIRHDREAIAILERTLGSGTPDMAERLLNIGVVLERKGDLPAALSSYREALIAARDTLGEEHTTYAQAHANIGSALELMGEYREALEHLERALAIFVRERGPRHHGVASIHGTIGYSLAGLGRFDEALEHQREAFAIDQDALPAGHSRLAADRNAIGEVLGFLGRPAEAVAEHRQALEIQLAALGEGHPNTGWSHLGIGWAEAALGHDEEALAAFRAMASIFAKGIGESHRGVALGTTGVFVSATMLGRSTEASDAHARLLRLAALPDADPVVAHLLALVDAMATTPRTRASEAAVRAARVALEQRNQWGYGPMIQRWLARRRGR